jgi:hypothetical protein
VRYSRFNSGTAGNLWFSTGNVIILTCGGHRSLTELLTDGYKHWVEGYGIEHRQADSDPKSLLRPSTEHKVSATVSGFRPSIHAAGVEPCWYEGMHSASVLSTMFYGGMKAP